MGIRSNFSLLIAVILSVLSMLIALAGVPSKPAPKPKVIDKQISLTMWVQSLDTAGLINKAAKAFHELHPGIVIDVVKFAPGQYELSLQSAIASKNLPDLFQLQSSFSPLELKQRGLIQALPPGSVDLNQFDPMIWQEGSTLQDGVPYVWPDRSYNRGPIVMYYNKKLLKRGDLDSESPPHTWDELVTQAERIKPYTDEKNGAPVQIALKEKWLVERLVGQLGTTSGQSAITIESFKGYPNWIRGSVFVKQPLIQATERIVTLRDGELANRDMLLTDELTAANRFALGQSAFLFAGHWFVGDFVHNHPDLSFGIKELPTINGFPPYFGVFGGSPEGFMIGSRNVHLGATKLWLQFLQQTYYPELIQSSTDWSPIPELNRSMESQISEPFRQLSNVLQSTVRIQPNPTIADISEWNTVLLRNQQKESSGIGSIVQGYVGGDIPNIGKAFDDYGTQLQKHLQNAIDTTAGGTMQHWTFPDWDIRLNYNTHAQK